MSGLTFNPQYTFIRGRQLEGTYPGDARTGIWPITALRVGRGWGYVPDYDWEYDPSTWPPNEPLGLDAVAKKFSNIHYQRVRSLREIKIVLSGMESAVMVSLSITSEWHSTTNGMLSDLTQASSPVGNHSVLLFGYEDASSTLKFRNSWGPGWGTNGNGLITYDLFDATWTEGWYSTLTPQIRPNPSKSSTRLLSWGLEEHGGGVFHCCELVDAADNKIAWTFAIERDGKLEIEELFVMPHQRKKGFGHKLLTEIKNLAKERRLKISAWISYADDTASNLTVVSNLAVAAGLRLMPSPVRWASQVAA